MPAQIPAVISRTEAEQTSTPSDAQPRRRQLAPGAQLRRTQAEHPRRNRADVPILFGERTYDDVGRSNINEWEVDVVQNKKGEEDFIEKILKSNGRDTENDKEMKQLL